MTLKRELIVRVEEHLESPLVVGEDMRDLQRAFAALMDRVWTAVQMAGLDGDDCVLERFATVKIADTGEIAEFEVGSLADPATFRKSLLRNGLRHIFDGNIVLTGLAIEAIRAPDYPDVADIRDMK